MTPSPPSNLIPRPWENEPDRVEWVDDKTNLPCLIRRGPVGALCGYVGVPTSHPLHGVGYWDCVAPGCDGDWDDGESCPHGSHVRPDDLVEVHGGLTYAASCDGEPSSGICHQTDDDDDSDDPDDETWWFGFDCAHAWDLAPGLAARRHYFGDPDVDGTYRDIEYVRAEVTALAQQLAEVAQRPSIIRVSRLN